MQSHADESIAPPRIRLMTAADVPFAMELKNVARWNQVVADWHGYLAFEPDGCFVAEIDGEPAGTATTSTYDGKVGWIGMVLVHPNHRRRGIGTALLRHCIEHLQRRGIACIKLDATPMGRPVYLPLGFRDEYELRRYEGVMPAARGDADGVHEISSRDWEELIAFDTDAFGVNRGRVLRSLAARRPDWSLLTRDTGGRITGYLIAHEGHTALRIAPWVAADAHAAQQLFTAAQHRLAGHRIFLDVPVPNAAGIALVEAAGFSVQRPYTRMWWGQNLATGEVAHIYAGSGAEKG